MMGMAGSSPATLDLFDLEVFCHQVTLTSLSLGKLIFFGQLAIAQVLKSQGMIAGFEFQFSTLLRW